MLNLNLKSTKEIQGVSKRAIYIFQKPSVKNRLDDLSPELYPLYLRFMALLDFYYYENPETIEAWSNSTYGIAGKVKLSDRNK